MSWLTKKDVARVREGGTQRVTLKKKVRQQLTKTRWPTTNSNRQDATTDNVTKFSFLFFHLKMSDSRLTRLEKSIYNVRLNSVSSVWQMKGRTSILAAKTKPSGFWKISQCQNQSNRPFLLKGIFIFLTFSYVKLFTHSTDHPIK